MSQEVKVSVKNLFKIFGFELRSIGFHPRAPDFNDQPTLFLGGKVSFMEAGDIFNAKIDVDKLGIAPPAEDSGLPQIKFDRKHYVYADLPQAY